MYGLGWLGAFLVGVTVAASLGTSWRRVYGFWSLGLLLAVFFVLVIYLTRPADFAHSHGVEGREFLGRWWDPEYVLLLAAIGYAAWFLGVCIGAAGRFLMFPARDARAE